MNNISLLKRIFIFTLVMCLSFSMVAFSVDLTEVQNLDKNDASTGIALNDQTRNLAKNVATFLVDPSSYATGQFGHFAVDGDEKTAWKLSEDVKNADLTLSLGAGIWFNKIVISPVDDKIISFYAEYYNQGNWVKFLDGDAIKEKKEFTFDPIFSGGLKITINTSGGGGITELEVYNTTDKINAPDQDTSALLTAKLIGTVALKLNVGAAIVNGVKTLVDKENTSVVPMIENSRTLVPIPFISESLGANVFWINETKSVVIKFNDKVITMAIGENKIDVNGEKVTIEVPAQIKEGRTYLPLRAISELVNKKVFWDDRGLILISDKEFSKENDQVLIDTLINELNSDTAGFSKLGGNDVTITPTLTVSGQSLKYVAVRGGDGNEGAPGDSTASWMKYFGFNGIRTWKSTWARSTTPQVIKKDEEVTDLDSFDSFRDKVRKNPDEYIDFDAISKLDKYKNADNEYAVYKKLGVTVINATGMGIWPNDFKSHRDAWLMLYANTYFLADKYDIYMHQSFNEPESFMNKKDVPHTLSEYVFYTKLTGDAIKSALADVKKKKNASWDGKFIAPVLASSGTSDLAKSMLSTNTTDYRGRPLDANLIDIYDKHKYGNRPLSYVREIDGIRNMLKEITPDKKELPMLFSEFNYSTSGNWKGKSITNDSPEVFRSTAYTWMTTTTSNVWAMYMFKFLSTNFPDANTFNYLFKKEVDPEFREAQVNDFGYATKNGEVVHLFSEGFKNQVDLYDTKIESYDPNYRVLTSYVPESNNYYMWMVQPSNLYDYNTTINLSNLDVSAGNYVTIKEVSATSFGEVTHNFILPQDKTIKFTQKKDSVYMLSVPKGNLLNSEKISATDSATVTQGASADKNFGGQLNVRRGKTSDDNNISYLKFDAKNIDLKAINRAILNLSGKQEKSDAKTDGSTIRVYGIANDSWAENAITAQNAPNIYKTVSTVKDLDYDNLPVGHMTFFKNEAHTSIDVTNFVKEHKDSQITFIIIREMNKVDEDSSNDGVILSAKDTANAPYLQISK